MSVSLGEVGGLLKVIETDFPLHHWRGHDFEVVTRDLLENLISEV